MVLCPWDSPGKNAGVGWVAKSPLGDLPDPGMETEPPEAPALLVDSSWLSCQGKPVGHHRSH